MPRDTKKSGRGAAAGREIVGTGAPGADGVRRWARRAVGDWLEAEGVTRATLKACREHAGLTFAEMGEILGLHRTVVFQFEKRTNHELGLVERYLAAIGGTAEFVAEFPGRKPMTFDGRDLAALRERLGVTRPAVADAMGVAMSNVWRQERAAASLKDNPAAQRELLVIFRYVAALGGTAHLFARFGGRRVEVEDVPVVDGTQPQLEARRRRQSEGR